MTNERLTLNVSIHGRRPDINRKPTTLLAKKKKKEKTLFALRSRVSMLLATLALANPLFNSASTGAVELTVREENSFRFYVSRVFYALQLSAFYGISFTGYKIDANCRPQLRALLVILLSDSGCPDIFVDRKFRNIMQNVNPEGELFSRVFECSHIFH